MTAHNFAGNKMIAAQQRRGFIDATLLDQLSNTRTANAFFPYHNRFHSSHFEVISGSPPNLKSCPTQSSLLLRRSARKVRTKSAASRAAKEASKFCITTMSTPKD